MKFISYLTFVSSTPQRDAYEDFGDDEYAMHNGVWPSVKLSYLMAGSEVTATFLVPVHICTGFEKQIS